MYLINNYFRIQYRSESINYPRNRLRDLDWMGSIRHETALHWLYNYCYFFIFIAKRHRLVDCAVPDYRSLTTEQFRLLSGSGTGVRSEQEPETAWEYR